MSYVSWNEMGCKLWKSQQVEALPFLQERGYGREGGVSVFVCQGMAGVKETTIQKKVKPKSLSFPLFFPQVPSPPFSSLPILPPLSLSLSVTYKY